MLATRKHKKKPSGFLDSEQAVTGMRKGAVS